MLFRDGAPVDELLTDGPDRYRAHRALPDDRRRYLRTCTVRAARPEVGELDVDGGAHRRRRAPAEPGARVEVRWLVRGGRPRGTALGPAVLDPLCEPGIAHRSPGGEPEDVDLDGGLLREVPGCPTVGAERRVPRRREEAVVLRVLVGMAVLLLGIWVLVGLFGWIVEGLFWLALVGVVVLAGSALAGSGRGRP